MATVFLVRHGQASFGSANYDSLSDLGRQQARWLGEYFRERGVRFRCAVSGELVRQQDTAREILSAMGVPAEFTVHPGLNEYDGHSVYTAYTGRVDQHVHQREDYRDYWRTFRAAYAAWIADELTDIAETWGAFGARIDAAIAQACDGAGKDDAILVVSSGGVIGRTVNAVLGGSPRSCIELNFQFRNAAFCELISGAGAMRLLSFNSVPHLDRPDRRHALTFV